MEVKIRIKMDGSDNDRTYYEIIYDDTSIIYTFVVGTMKIAYVNIKYEEICHIKFDIHYLIGTNKILDGDFSIYKNDYNFNVMNNHEENRKMNKNKYFSITWFPKNYNEILSMFSFLEKNV